MVPLLNEDRDYLRRSQCGYYSGQPMVCCLPNIPPRIDTSDLLPQPGVCGSDTSDRIYGGEKTDLGEYPWMALLEYSKRM